MINIDSNVFLLPMKNLRNNSTKFGKTSRRRFLQSSIALAGAGAILTASEVGSYDTSAQVVSSDAKQLIPYGSGQPTYVSDLNNCVPSSAMSKKWQKKKWKLLEFETEQTKGTMLVSGQNTTPPEVKYSFKQKGWYAIYIALYSYRYYSRVQVKLKSDPVFSILTQRDEVWRRQYEEGRGIYFSIKIDELFWKYADLTDEEMTFRTVTVQTVPEDENSVGNVNNAVWVPYVKLIPLSEKEVEDLKNDQKQKESRRLIATNDVFTPMCWGRWTTEEDIRREVEPLRKTDLFRLEWEAGWGDVTLYPSKIGRYFTLDWQENPYSQVHRLYMEGHNELRRKNIDPLRVATDAAHDAGLEFYAAYRTAGFRFPPPEDEWNAGGFFDQHPEFRTRDKEGRETPRLSYAYPEVRQFIISLLTEMTTNYPIDGISLYYCRRPPLFDYELPLVEGFLAEYGEDPRKLKDEDPRWLSYRSRYLTTFMRDLKKSLNGAATKQGRKKPIGITAVVPGTERENRYFGMDLGTWVKEGLIDTLVGWGGLHFDRMTFIKPDEANYFVNMTKTSRCKLALNIMPRVMTPDEYMQRASSFYNSGVDYLYFWDTYQRADYSPAWTAIRRLGHREEIEAWAKAGSSKMAQQKTIKFLKAGNWDYRYSSPG